MMFVQPQRQRPLQIKLNEVSMVNPSMLPPLEQTTELKPVASGSLRASSTVPTAGRATMT